MRAATSVALIALLAAPVFASPASSAPIEEEPSISTQIISSAAGGAASGAVGNLLSKIENLFRRDVGGRSAGTLTSIVKQAQTLSAADKATVKTALVNKISTLQAPSKRLSVGDAAGKALGGLASEGAKTAVGGLLTDIENLFRRDEPKLDARAGLGGAIASSVAGGAASGLVGNLLGELESFLKRDDLGELGAFDDPEDLPDFNNFGIPDPIPAGDNGLFGVSIIARAGLGGAIASSVAGGAASGLVGNLLGELESFLKREVGTVFPGGSVPIVPLFREGVPAPLEARAPLSATSLGGSIVSSAAGGATSGLVGNLLSEIENFFRRDASWMHGGELYVKRDAGSISNIITQAQTLSASDKATVKTALMNKIATLQSKRDLISSINPSSLGPVPSTLSFPLSDFPEGQPPFIFKARDVRSISNIIKQAQNLPASDRAAVKSALMNKIGALQEKRDALSSSNRLSPPARRLDIGLEDFPPGQESPFNLPSSVLDQLLGISQRSEKFEINDLD